MPTVTREAVELFFPDEIAFSNGMMLKRRPITSSETHHLAVYFGDRLWGAWFRVPRVLRDDQPPFPWPPDRWQSEMAKAEGFASAANTPSVEENVQ